MVFEHIRRADDYPEVTDFADEKELLKFVRKSRWVSVDLGSWRLFRFNWRGGESCLYNPFY